MFASCSLAVLSVFILQRHMPLRKYSGGNLAPRLSFQSAFTCRWGKRAWERVWARGILKRRFQSENSSNVFRPHWFWRNLKTKKLLVILDLCLTCLRKTRAGKSRDYRDVIVFKKLLFRIVFCPQEKEKSAFSNINCSSLGNVFERSSVFVTD